MEGEWPEGVKTLILFQWEMASKMKKIGDGILRPPDRGERDPLISLLTNLISRKVSYKNVFRNIFSLDLNFEDLLNVYLNRKTNPFSLL